MSETSILEIISNDRKMIMYRPEWRKYTGSVTATILLSQILYRWNKSGQRPFYKFKAPCGHCLYTPGDSWIEELGFSAKEFDAALKKIAFKRTAKNRSQHHIFPVEYSITRDRVTYYSVITENFESILQNIYRKKQPEPPPFGIFLNDQRGSSVDPQREVSKTPKGDLPENDKREVSKIPKGDLSIVQRLPEGETTAAEREKTPPAAFSSESEMENLIALIPVKISAERRSWLIQKGNEYGLYYLKEKILYSNQNIKDRRKYWSYLGKALQYNYGQHFLSDLEAFQEQEAEQKGQEKEKQQKRQAQHRQIQAQLDRAAEAFHHLPPDEQQKLRDEFMKSTNRFEVRRMKKLTLEKSTQNKSFLMFCADRLTLN